MKAKPAAQMDLLEAPKPVEARQGALSLVIQLDHRAWMRFLNEEWIQPTDSGAILMGVCRPVNTNISRELTPVGVWFDPEKLPDLPIKVWKDGSWRNMLLDQLSCIDAVIGWIGPLPLYAVEQFTFETSAAKDHMMSMARHFADIDLPQQPAIVAVSDGIDSMNGPLVVTETFKPPANWDALRGAAAMALLTVPSIGPWLTLLCELLNSGSSNFGAELVEAPWLETAVWSSPQREDAKECPLWQAILLEFSRPGALKEWQPQVILQNVCAEARRLGYNTDQLLESTLSLLRDEIKIDSALSVNDPVAVVFQLVLLRPSPVKYVTWKDDWPSMPPAIWWTGAILSGFLSGFRALPIQFRGSMEARRIAALKTWQLSCVGHEVRNKQTFSTGDLSWASASEAVIIFTEHEFLSEIKFSNRGRWFELDLSKSDNLELATQFAEQACPNLLRQVITLKDQDFRLVGPGSASIVDARKTLRIKGQVEFEVNDSTMLRRRLEINDFKRWLVSASIDSKIIRPPAADDTEGSVSHLKVDEIKSVGRQTQLTANDTPLKRGSSKQLRPPEGLTIIEDFISDEDESNLLELIDCFEWDTSMSRRVQHYGWRYDYKARKVDQNSYLGPLPNWISALGRRLFDLGYLSHVPDQVIINEYVGSQSISKHIDCVPCFKGAIATLSLNESWEMLFTRLGVNNDEERYRTILKRRSVAVLDGPARFAWKHEIPKKLKENGIARGRRVSITFRKVNIGGKT